MDFPYTTSRRSGFTLIEISMVLLLFASAVGGLLSFFPVGLKLENSAVSDSAQTMFALDVIGQIEANAAAVDNFGLWRNDDFWTSKNVAKGKSIMYNVKAGGKQIEVTGSDSSKKQTLSPYLGSSDTISYCLDIVTVDNTINFKGRYRKSDGKKDVDDGYLRRAVIWVSDRPGGNPKLSPPFVVDLVYMPGDWKE